MSEEEKKFAAVATFADDGSESTVSVPEDITEVIARVDEIVAKYDMGDVLSEEDKAAIKAYLPAIGVDESGLSADNALVGKGAFAFKHAEVASASFFDRYTLAQWGFYYTARCEILTDKGTIVIK